MRQSSNPRFFALATVLAVLAASSPVVSCPPRPSGLFNLTLEADQAIEVEIVDVSRARFDWLRVEASRLREATIDASEEISRDLALLLDETLPTVTAEPESPVVATARVLGHLDAEGPRVGSLFRWRARFWRGQEELPGRRAIVFLGASQDGDGSYDLNVLARTDAVMVLGEHEDAPALSASVASLFSAKQHKFSTSAVWKTQMMASPAARIRFRDLEVLMEGMPPETLVSSLIDHPSGTYNDILLLEKLAKVSSHDLDLFALELVEAVLKTKFAWMAAKSMSIALERWQIEAAFEPAEDSRYDIEELRDQWQKIVADSGLPVLGNPRLPRLWSQWKFMTEEGSAQYSRVGG